MPKIGEMTHRAWTSFGSVSILSFSGGRTSGYMLRKVLDAKVEDDRPNRLLHVAFCNTGKEYEETLEFVNEVDERWKVGLHWLEYVRNEKAPPVIWKGKQPLSAQHSFRKVDFKNASCNGEPFEQLIDALAAYRKAAGKGRPVLPNPVQRMCSSEMKKRTVERFMKSLGHRFYSSLIGIRYNEPDRAVQLMSCSSEARGIYCPLYEARITVDHVMQFWAGQLFDLKLAHDPEMGTYQGNCDMCFLKRKGKIKRIAAEEPERVRWWAAMEEKTGGLNFRKDRFTYCDLRDGRVPLDVCETKSDDDVSCHCTD